MKGEILLHHMGIITREIEESIRLYKRLGYNQIEYYDDELQNNKIALLSGRNKVKIELIQPKNKKSFVWRAAEGYHHLCFTIKNIEMIRDILLKPKDGIVVKGPLKAIAFNNCQIYFVCLLTGELIEFLLDKAEEEI